MPRPQVTKPRIFANKIFVNREDPLRVFKEVAANIPYDNVELLVYYGLGGIGKTELRKRFEAALKNDKTFSNIHFAVLDLHERKNLDPALSLVYIRNVLAQSKMISFPAFDLAFALYWQEAYPEKPIELLRGWAAGGDDVAANIIEDMASFAAEGIPFVGKALRCIISHGIKVGKQKYTMATNDALKSIFREGKPMDPVEIEKHLPFLLADDLKQQLLKDKEYRFVIFIDEYERVFDEGGFAAQRRDNSFDEAIRNLIAELNGSLVVIMSREQLPWDEFKPEWKDWLKDAHHRLEGLSFKDAEKFLLAVPVPEDDIRLAIIAGSGADLPTENEKPENEKPIYPLLLDLQLDHYLQLKELNPNLVRPEEFSIKADSFKDLRNQILRRFLRDYPSFFESTLKRLSIARHFDRTLLIYLVKEFATGFPLDRFEELSNMSFVEETKEEKFLMIHNSIRSALQEFMSPEDVKETHEAIVKYYTPLATPKDQKSISEVNIDAFNELVYSKCCLAPDNLKAWWDEVSSVYRTNAISTKLLEKNLRLILGKVEKALGPSHPDTIASLNDLASIFDFQGKYTDAQTLYERVLKNSESTLGPDHPDTASTLNNLAGNLDAQGKYMDAQTLYKRTLKIYESTFGPNHPYTALNLNNLALNLNSQGLYAQAQPLYERALKIYESTLSPDHPYTASTLNNLALNLNSQGLYAQAQPLLERTLKIYESTLDPDHPYTASTLNNLVLNLNSQGLYAQAQPLLERALKTCESTFGLDHPETASSLNNWGYNLNLQGLYAQAQPLYERALKICEFTLGPDHPNTASSLNNLALNLNSQGLYAQAQPLLERTLKIYESTLGPNHPYTTICLYNLAMNLKSQGL